MEEAFSYMTFAFGGALLLYACLLWLTGDVNMIPKNQAAAIQNPKRYARTFALLILFLALAFLSGAWVGLFAGPLVGALSLVICLVLAIWLDVRLWKKENKK